MAESGGPTVNQLTARGFDDEVDRAIRRLAERESISLNKAAIRLLRRGAGLEPGTIGASLDHLAGTWSEEDFREFEAVEADFERGCVDRSCPAS